MKKMQLGVIIDYFKEESYKFAAELGFSFLEVTHNVGLKAKDFEGRLPEIQGYMEKYGIGIGSVGRWGTDKFDENGSIIEDELAENLLLIDCAAKLGCEVFVTGVNYAKNRSLFDNASITIDYLKKLIDHGKKCGVKIATYNCNWGSYLTGPEQWRLIHGHLPELGIKYDPTHCINDGSGDYLGETADWGSRFYHVHIKGTLKINGRHVDDPPAGLDMINWGAFLGILYDHGYDGTLSIEPHSGTWKGEMGDRGIKYSFDYISKMLLN